MKRLNIRKADMDSGLPHVNAKIRMWLEEVGYNNAKRRIYVADFGEGSEIVFEGVRWRFPTGFVLMDEGKKVGLRPHMEGEQ